MIPTNRFELHRALGVDAVSFGAIETNSFVETYQFTGSQIAPRTGWNALDRHRTHPHPAQPFHFDTNGIHHPPHHMEQTFMQHHPDRDAFPGFPQQPDFVRHNQAILDFDPFAQAFELPVVRSLQGEDVIFLHQSVARVHHAVRDIANIGQQDQSLRFTVEPANRIDAFLNIDEIHHRPAVAFILDGGNESGGFVEHDESRFLTWQGFAIDMDAILAGIHTRAEDGHNLAVDGHSPGRDHGLGGTARGDTVIGDHPLQAFTLWWRVF